MYNKVILIGNLTRDPEVRYTPGGMPIGTVSLAVNSKFKQGEEMKEETLFINCTIFGKQAESCGQYLTKGNPVLVEGRLKEDKWEKEGEKKSKFVVITSTLRFLPKKNGNGASAGAAAGGGNPAEHTDLEPF